MSALFSRWGLRPLPAVLLLLAGMILAAFWLAITIWAYRDMRARSRDSLAQILVGLMVALQCCLCLSEWLDSKVEVRH